MKRARPINPWCEVPAEQYEGHMGPAGVDQLRPLSAVLGGALAELRPNRLLVLGVATGNGLEHVDPAATRRVVGVDVNEAYLALTRERHRSLGSGLELHCDDAAELELEPGSFDLIWAGLFLEHVDPARLVPRMAGWLAPGGWLVAALQLPGGGGPVTPSRFPAIHALAGHMRLVDPNQLGAQLVAQGLRPRAAEQLSIAGGKALHVARWQRPARPRARR